MGNPDYDANECREKYVEEMISQGYMIVYPAPNELQIDMDTEEHYQLFKRQFDSLLREHPDAHCIIKPSRNGLLGRHATIAMPFAMSDAERMAWQAALGSDPFRELMSLFRIKRGDNHPTLFVEKTKHKKFFEVGDFF